MEAEESANTPEVDKLFTGAVPRIYEELLVPMLFASYADDLARRVADRAGPPRDVTALLEIAAGTGVVTRELAARLPASVSIVATDLNQPMLDQAARIGTGRPVQWRQADAMQLPFADASFDLVVCQFGVMFFPDRSEAYAESRRVLKPGGAFIFSTWDRIAANEFADTVQRALDGLYPDDAPRFMERTPHGYFEPRLIRDDLARGGFRAPAVITPVRQISRAASARIVAEAFCQGTPLRPALEARGPHDLARATDAAEIALAHRFGNGAIEGALSAMVVEIPVG